MKPISPERDAQLLGYLVGGLEEVEQEQVASEIEADPQLRRRLDELSVALAPLAADKVDAPAPRDLAVRTLAHIAEHCCRELPRAPAPLPRDVIGFSRSWWKRVDVLVAACLLLTALGLGAPALLRLRADSARLECQNNLREFGEGLLAYREHHRQFPNIAEKSPHDLAGLVVPILADAGVLSKNASIRCPGNGRHQACSVTLKDVLASDPQHVNAALFTSCYSYSLGYKDDLGYHAPQACGDQAGSLVALMSDGPPTGLSLSNSPNHGGDGQNILFSDGSVRFHATRMLAGDDIFTNNARQVAAGLDCRDIVLGKSSARP